MSRPLVVVAAVSLVLLLLVFTNSAAPQGDVALIERIDAMAAAPLTFSLFVHHDGDIWFQPLAVYPSALLLRVGVPRDLALAAPAAAAGVVTLALTFVLALRAPMRQAFALIATVCVLLSPGFVWFARAAGADLLMVAMLLTWCLVVLEHASRPQRWLPIAGGVALATSAYTQPAGVLAALVVFVIGAIVWHRAQVGWRSLALATAAAAVALLPIGVWLLRYPEAYPDTFGRWAIHAAHVRNPIDGIVAFTRWHVASRRVGAYWAYLSPTFLFASGQLFALWAVVLVPLGLWTTTARPLTHGRMMIVAAFLAAPLAAVLLDVERAARFVPLIIPFGAMLASLAVEGLRSGRRRIGLAVAIATAGLAVVELTRFGK